MFLLELANRHIFDIVILEIFENVVVSFATTDDPVERMDGHLLGWIYQRQKPSILAFLPALVYVIVTGSL